VQRYFLRRVVEIVPTIVIVTAFIFVLMRLLPGDPILEKAVQSEGGRLNPQQVAVLKHQLGLDRSWPEQYVTWVKGVATGNWGRTASGQQQVATLVWKRARVSLQIGFFALLLATTLAIPIGVVSALRRNSWLDVSITSFALAGLAAPNFVLALLLILAFGIDLHWLPTQGIVPFQESPGEWLRHLVLPVITLAVAALATIVRQTRSAVLEVMREDYVRTARAMGLSGFRIIQRHTLRNALLPVVTIAALQVGHLVSGAIIVESIFGVAGMGRLTIDSVLGKDYGTIQVLVMIFALMTIAANLAADKLYMAMDPRIRLR
jgi:peptide/nickel transport system permease protein